MSSGNKSYIVIFKDDAKPDVINAEIEKVEKEGGTITHRYDSSIMRGFAARMPETMAQSYNSLTEGGKHSSIDYIEPDGEVRTQ